ncbi:MAG TPA: cytochrome c oxidase subunit 3 [Candidatus Polarisedimenticolaceae bacterium]|nr:cytochrome c oxidase subunit 3 [Candidatus Polarisedimenticolaceae bacterium]
MTRFTDLRWDDGRGIGGMWLFIVTEAFLFVSLFFAYFYLGSRGDVAWPPQPPKITLALVMLAILLASSVVLHLGERALKRDRRTLAHLAIGGTILLGLGFAAVQAMEYRERLKSLRPSTDAYGSIFYTITGFHGGHLVLGLLMLVYVLVLPRLEPAREPPHRPLKNAALYWHFVDAVWVVIVALLYLLPRLTRGA